MSGLGAIFNIAGSALSTQKYGLEVTANNISNVNTPGYTRQSPMLQPAPTERIGNLTLGRGVSFEGVTGINDEFVESRLRDQGSKASFFSSQQDYLDQIEQIFSTGSGADVSSLMFEFWNSWQDLANFPSGTAERRVLSEKSLQLSEGFNRLTTQMDNLVQDIDNRLDTGAKDVNRITSGLADLNQQIVSLETGGKTALALRDQRNMKLNELSELMNISSFELDTGALTIMTANGIDLVRDGRNFDLSMEDGQLKLAGSGGNEWDVTDQISGGRIGGWLDMRNNIIHGFRTDLDETAEALIWQVNGQHSQGVGLEKFTSVTGDYAFDPLADLGTILSSSGLAFQDRIEGDALNPTSVTVWIYDAEGQPIDSNAATLDVIDGFTIDITKDMTLQDLLNKFNPENVGDPDPVPYIQADIVDNRFQITADDGYSFGFSDDTSHVLAALGINTFFKGDDAATMAVSDLVKNGGPYIAAGTIGDQGSHAKGDNSNAIAIADLQYTPMEIGNNQGNTGVLDTTTENYFHTLLGGIGITGSG
ncbi:MAG: flagellar hook-associated protein FlgK, partial [Desulfotignum sp.]|nr:flagellar hook-associated protein FlgK [Desulfotignum sp.]